PERVSEVDRVHEAAVLDAAVVDAALIEADDGLVERRLGDREGDVVDGAGVGRGAGGLGRAGLVGEDRDQTPVAGVEVEVALGLAVEVGLLEHEGHAQDALPEVDRGLAVGAHEGDVVDALGLELLHVVGLPSSSCSTSFDLYSLRCRVPHGTRSMRVCTTSAARRRSRMLSARRSSARASRASSTLTGSGGSCLTPCARGRTRTWPLTSGAKALTISRTALGKTLTP